MIQFLVTTLSSASVYVLVAVALNIVHRSSGVLFFGAGHVAVFVGIFHANELSAGVWGVGVAMFAGIILSIVCYLVVVLPGEKIGVTHVPLSLATLGFGLVVDFFAGEFWLKQAFASEPLLSRRFEVLGVTFAGQRVMAVVVAGVFITLIALLIDRSMIGHAMEATAADNELAQLYGVQTNLVGLSTWAVAGAALGLAGYLQASVAAISAPSAIPLVVFGIVVAVVGGLGSFTKALGGAIVVAGAQAAFVQFVSPRYSVSMVFLLLFAVLILRPSGLFSNTRIAERV